MVSGAERPTVLDFCHMKQLQALLLPLSNGMLVQMANLECSNEMTKCHAAAKSSNVVAQHFLVQQLQCLKAYVR